MKRTIEKRPDIELLVNTFYDRIRQDHQLGPIFNGIINNWPEHLERLINFWETNLLFIKKYKGNPVQAHNVVDEKVDGILSAEHFERWLQLWGSTLDQYFTGPNAEKAKKRAENMSRHLLLKILEGRETTTSKT